jgi:tRNA A37 N6-isopentenylltransferase MiaA
LYLQTWEDGISGRPSLAKLERQALAAKQQEQELSEMSKTENNDPTTTSTSQPPWPDNAVRNLHLIRQDAARILDQAKEQTGIHTKDDLKTLATEMMKLATECLREFMAGYREGRDQEMDKMINEYFRDELKSQVQQEEHGQAKRQQSEGGRANDGDESIISRPPRKRRRPKRGIPRD